MAKSLLLVALGLALAVYTTAETLKEPMEYVYQDGDVIRIDLVMQTGFKGGLLANSSTGLNLRLFHYPDLQPNGPVYGQTPTIVAKPGQAVYMQYCNKLGPDPDYHDDYHLHPHNVLAYLNSTNMHLHGLYIAANSDDDQVKVQIKPGECFEYTYEIPKEHHSTFAWYHPHFHGSSTIQVAQGAFGAFLIRNDVMDASLPAALRDAPSKYIALSEFLLMGIGGMVENFMLAASYGHREEYELWHSVATDPKAFQYMNTPDQQRPQNIAPQFAGGAVNVSFPPLQQCIGGGTHSLKGIYAISKDLGPRLLT